MRFAFLAALSIGALALAACATPSPASSVRVWGPEGWAAQPAKTVSGGRFAFSAMPYGRDGFQLKLSIKTGAVGISGAANGAPDEAQLLEAAKAAAPEGCSVKSVTRTEDGGAVADYECA